MICCSFGFWIPGIISGSNRTDKSLLPPSEGCIVNAGSLVGLTATWRNTLDGGDGPLYEVSMIRGRWTQLGKPTLHATLIEC